ncbi:MAG: CoA transferase [Dehalococcoidales bacterium]|nr:CoA transferase [Dehalococcoidales bacterium]
MSGALTGIRILDLSWVLSAPFATMVLSDLGAEVIKVERPKVGDIARDNGPHVRGISTYFLSLNRGKKSVSLNLASATGKEIFLGLVKHVDVVVENFVPGTMKKLGLDYEILRQHHPQLIYAACSGFGQTGPYATKPAFDVIVQAMGGILSTTGEPGGPPVRPGASLGDIAAGLFLAIAILAALQERHTSGQGQMIDLSMLDCQMAIQENAFVRYLATGEVPKALGTRHPVFTPFQVFPTKDGYVAVATMGGVKDQWPLFCATIGRLDIIDDARFATGWLRTQNYAVLEPTLNEAMQGKTTEEWLREFEAVGFACGPVNTIDRVAADPQIAHRGMIIDVNHPRAGSFKVVNTPIKLSRTPARVQQASPDLGEHTEETLIELLGMTHQQVSELRNSGII